MLFLFGFLFDDGEVKVIYTVSAFVVALVRGLVRVNTLRRLFLITKLNSHTAEIS